jgi:hypothetical protein
MKDSVRLHLYSPVVARILRIRARIHGRDASHITSSLEQDILQYVQELEDLKHSLQIEMTAMAASESWDMQRIEDRDGEKWTQWDQWDEKSPCWMPEDLSGQEPEAI